MHCMKRTLFVLSLLAVMASSDRVFAGGYDTPILYSARHMGMGGTAVSYVYDPSAIFHNPAGLGHTKFFSATLDVSPLIGHIVSSPEKATAAPEATNMQSETVFAPFFLAGAGLRVTDWLTVGIGAYPVASASGSYKYIYSGDKDFSDSTKLVFIELAPGVAVNLPFGLKLGATYRVTLLTFDRVKGENGSVLDMSMSGVNLAGFKLGLQWQPLPWLQAGVVYRHKTVTEVTADKSTLFIPSGKTDMKFTLPSKLGVGVRADLGPLGVALDAEYGLNSQNVNSIITAQPLEEGGPELQLKSQFRWHDSLTLRGGLEYSVLPKLLKLRTGYVYDSTVSNKTYPTAFGTPPGPTQVFTGGLGTEFTLGKVGMEVNLAYAYRFGTGTVTEEDIKARPEGGDFACPACSYPGDYEIELHGMYLDASVYF
jgi:long-subunit fatty acid transport protein